MNELSLKERLGTSMTVHTVAKQLSGLLLNLVMLKHSFLKETDILMPPNGLP